MISARKPSGVSAQVTPRVRRPRPEGSKSWMDRAIGWPGRARGNCRGAAHDAALAGDLVPPPAGGSLDGTGRHRPTRTRAADPQPGTRPRPPHAPLAEGAT